jgi:arginyl-tRNA synthetase
MQLPWEDRIQHVDFGMMRLPEGKMSTREGRVVFLEDVLDRAVAEAGRIIAEKNPDLVGEGGAAAIAEQVGVGAVVFNDLKRERVKDVEFVWEEVLSFEGETGPYVQYTHARLASILRKALESGEGAAEPDWKLLEDAGPLLLALGRFPTVLQSAAEHAEPSELTAWLLSTSRDVNNWYVGHRVLGQAPPLTAARLHLVRASKAVIANGLRLLGVGTPEEM